MSDKNDSKNEQIWCVAFPDNDNHQKPQLVCFAIDDNKCIDAIRIDVTEYNIEEVKQLCIKGLGNFRIKPDEFEKGTTIKNLKGVLEIADAISIH